MENTLTDRVKIVMETEGLSPSTFADSIGVQRPSMSHILSGRNKPSIDIVQKLILTFPQYNPIWLINGTGDMLQLDLFASEDDLKEKNTDKTAVKSKTAKKTKSAYQNINFVKQVLENDRLEEVQNTTTQAKPMMNTISEENIVKEEPLQPYNTTPKNEPLNINNPNMTTETPHYTTPAQEASTTSNPINTPIPPLFGMNDKKIERIVVFYADKTFAVYHPE
jgi:DNA-binding XRE family transcriptional regulator